jgi:hypothetical protein
MKALMKCGAIALTWALIYALPALPIEGLSNLGIQFPFTNAVDMWPMELGLPGLLAGVLFAALLALSGRLHSFETQSSGRLAALGAAAGLMVGAFYLWTVWPEPSPVAALILALAVGLGTLAGPGSALVFRLIDRRRAPASARARA